MSQVNFFIHSPTNWMMIFRPSELELGILDMSSKQSQVVQLFPHAHNENTHMHRHANSVMQSQVPTTVTYSNQLKTSDQDSKRYSVNSVWKCGQYPLDVLQHMSTVWRACKQKPLGWQNQGMWKFQKRSRKTSCYQEVASDCPISRISVIRGASRCFGVPLFFQLLTGTTLSLIASKHTIW